MFETSDNSSWAYLKNIPRDNVTLHVEFLALLTLASSNNSMKEFNSKICIVILQKWSLSI
jgi:hypothetical protein